LEGSIKFAGHTDPLKFWDCAKELEWRVVLRKCGYCKSSQEVILDLV